MLIGVRYVTSPRNEAEESLKELHALVCSLQIQVYHSLLVPLKIPTARYLVGTGKAGAIRDLVEEQGIDLIVFDESLSPSQQRNWELLTNTCVIDRQEVILEIFADRARTREAHLQVELARMEYSLPRLTRKWTNLSQQRGGYRGARGAGETQLELDRRKVLRRIQKCKRELRLVEEQRMVQRSRRVKSEILQGSIVGYTNAGKSSLLRFLTHADVLVEDKLFATLDPTTRKLRLPNGGEEILLSDTVGFIRKIPPQLIAAFKATLEETVLADFILHVLDVSTPGIHQRAATTRSVLREIGAGDKPVLTILNKIDLLTDRSELPHLLSDFPHAIPLSTKTGEGKDELLKALSSLVKQRTVRSESRILFHSSVLGEGDNCPDTGHSTSQWLESPYHG
ncbi:MAG: GTPase HflX [Spirochaetes bacterium]|nr:GTPase HflX [Spirochaetota bacterium]